MKMARSQLPPGALDAAPAGEDIEDRPTVEVKVHMMSVPMMTPMHPLAPVSMDRADDVSIQSTDKASKMPSQTRFPGIFFKPKDKEKTTKKQNGDKSKDNSKGFGKATKIVRESAAVSQSVKKGKESSFDNKQAQVSEADAARELDSLSAFFPEMVVTAPRDHTLKVLWDRMGDEEMGKKVSRLNRKLIEKELKRTKTKLRQLSTCSSTGKKI